MHEADLRAVRDEVREAVGQGDMVARSTAALDLLQESARKLRGARRRPAADQIKRTIDFDRQSLYSPVRLEGPADLAWADGPRLKIKTAEASALEEPTWRSLRQQGGGDVEDQAGPPSPHCGGGQWLPEDDQDGALGTRDGGGTVMNTALQKCLARRLGLPGLENGPRGLSSGTPEVRARSPP